MLVQQINAFGRTKMPKNTSENDVMAGFRLSVEITAQQINQPLAIVARGLAGMVERGEANVIVGTASEAAAMFNQLANEYEARPPRLKSHLWIEGDELSALWLCSSCETELYAPCIEDYCPICQAQLPYVELWGEQDAKKQKKAASETKYICPECATNAWAKPEAKLICGACDEPMVAEPAEEGTRGNFCSRVR